MKLLLFSIMLLLCLVSMAQDLGTNRVINLKFEPIKGAVSYELELTRLDEGKRVVIKVYKLEIPEWNELLEPGVYEIRIRSIDFREIAGAWSPPSPINIKFPQPKIIRPIENEIIRSDEIQLQEVIFQWTPVRNVERYYLYIKDSKGKIYHDELVDGLTKIINLPVASEYEWIVRSYGGEDIDTKNLELNKFTVLGGALDTPDILINVDTKFFKIEWKDIAYAKNYTYTMYKRANKQTEWTLLKEKKEYKKNKVFFLRNKIKPDQYRFMLQARAKGRQNSGTAQMDFIWNGKTVKVEKVVKKGGNTNPLAKLKGYSFTLRPSIEKISYNGFVESSQTTVKNDIIGQSIDLLFEKDFTRMSFLGGLGIIPGSFVTKTKRISYVDFNLYATKEFKTPFFSIVTGPLIGKKTLPYITGDGVALTFDYGSQSFLEASVIFGIYSKFLLDSTWRIGGTGRYFAYLSGDIGNGSSTYMFNPNFEAYFELLNNITQKISLMIQIGASRTSLTNQEQKLESVSTPFKAAFIYKF